MKRPRIGVVGASGYSGGVTARLLASHPHFSLAFCTSDKRAGEPVAQHLGIPITGNGLLFSPNADAADLGREVDAVVLATSAEVSAELAPKLISGGTRVIDLSGAFRLTSAEDYTRWYRMEHPAPELLSRAHYGLPEVFGAPPEGTTLIANPGCYPTAAILALAPLLRAGLIEGKGLIIDAKSGVTGAGRQAKEEYSFSELDGDLRAYKLLAHQHTPEIARALGRFGEATLTFTPHLLPVRRGLLATCYARPRAGATPEAVRRCLEEAYGDEPFVRVASAERVTLAAVAGSNLAVVGAVANEDVVIAVCAIDNLVKGAAGQAVQNLNLLFGLDAPLGLTHLQPFAA